MRRVGPAELLKEKVQRAITRQHLLEPNRTNKRRHDHRDQQQRRQQAAPSEIPSGEHVRQGHCQHGATQGRRGRQGQGVQQCLAGQRARQQRSEVAQRPFARRSKRLPQQVARGIKQERAEERRQPGQEQERPSIEVPTSHAWQRAMALCRLASRTRTLTVAATTPLRRQLVDALALAATKDGLELGNVKLRLGWQPRRDLVKRAGLVLLEQRSDPPLARVVRCEC